MIGRFTREDGISLVELLVTLMVGTVVFVVFGQTLIGAQRVSNVQEEESRSIDILRTEVARIERDVRWAEQVSAPDPAAATGTPPNTTGDALQIVVRDGVGIAAWVTYELREDPDDPAKAELYRHQAPYSLTPPAIPTTGAVKIADDLVYSPSPFTFYPRQAGDRNAYLDLTLRVQLRDSREPREVTTRLSVRNVL